MTTETEIRNNFLVQCKGINKQVFNTGLNKMVDTLNMIRAIVHEQIGSVSEITVELWCEDRDLLIERLLGARMDVISPRFDALDVQKSYRRFCGIVVSVEEVDHFFGRRRFVVELRPTMWILSKRWNNRVFHEKNAKDIIMELLREHGLSDIGDNVSGSFPVREHCVQYNESDLDFVQRLMEEEGIFYHFEYPEGRDFVDELVLNNDSSKLTNLQDHYRLDIRMREFVAEGYQDDASADEAGLFDWDMSRHLTSGKVTLNDYNYRNARDKLEATNSIEKGGHSYKDKEVYLYQGHHDSKNMGGTRARVKMEAEAARFNRRACNTIEPEVAVGRRFQVGDTPMAGQDFVYTFPEPSGKIYYIARASHYLERPRDEITKSLGDHEGLLDYVLRFPEQAFSPFYTSLEAVPSEVPFRTEPRTPWPRIAGVQTAVVVSPNAGEEIYTDNFGRIKVQFHWDRINKKDDQSSCWIRVATPWAGAKWGMVAVPRVGQEVIVQFEEGNPDRPICTGMLYNDVNQVPYNYPADKTQSGIKSNTSKGGSGYNELMFEDAKGDELVRFQAQKDFKGLVKHDSDHTIDHDSKLKVSNNSTVTVGNNLTETIENNHSVTVTKGNQSTTVKMGDISIDAKLGAISITALKSIELKVGNSLIKIDQSGVTVQGIMITNEAKGFFTAKGAMTEVSAQGILTLKGGLVMIN